MKVYIGDSVYLTVEPHGYWLTTENGYPDDPRNKIFLEWGIHQALVVALRRASEDSEEK